jgi:hypothetical protein
MVVNLNDYIPLLAVIGSVIWAGQTANRHVKRAEESAAQMSEKLDTIHVLVNSQLTQAVDRLNVALAQVEELKALLKSRGT